MHTPAAPAPLPPVYVISLARATQRRATLAARMAGIPHQIVEAVDGSTLDLEALTAQGILRQDKSRQLCSTPRTRGEIGCYLSHTTLWQRIAQMPPQQCAVVLEDDVQLAEDFPQVVMDIANSPWHWEVVNLATLNPMTIPHSLHPVGNARRFGIATRAGACASAYLLRPTGARKLLHYCREIREPIDMLYVRWWRHGATFYNITPPAAHQLPQLGSTIGSRNTKPALWHRITASLHRKRERRACKQAVRTHQPRKAA